MHYKIVLHTDLPEHGEPNHAISMVEVDGGLSITSGGNMIKCAGKLEA
jgi:hypothetical protein